MFHLQAAPKNKGFVLKQPRVALRLPSTAFRKCDRAVTTKVKFSNKFAPVQRKRSTILSVFCAVFSPIRSGVNGAKKKAVLTSIV